MRARNTITGLIIAIALLAIAPLPAVASTTIGSDLSHAPNLLNCPGKAPATNTCSYAITSIAAPAAGGAVSPIDGVIVRWRVRAMGSVAATFLMANLHVLSGNTSKLRSEAVSLPLTDTVTERPARLPIAAGDRLGLTLTGISPDPFVIGIAQYHAVGPPIASSDRFPNPLTENTTQTPSPMAGTETLVNADVETDGDHDGFGDESQDLCPGSALSQSKCVPATITGLRFKRGEGFKLQLSEPASLSVSVQKLLAGRVAKNGSCSLRQKRGKRCTILKKAGSFTNLAATSGLAAIPFAPKKLAAAEYRATITATTALGQISSAQLNFKVKRARRVR